MCGAIPIENRLQTKHHMQMIVNLYGVGVSTNQQIKQFISIVKRICK
jgi:hypothetical protein